jgi:hypothetical protein
MNTALSACKSETAVVLSKGQCTFVASLEVVARRGMSWEGYSVYYQ